MVFIWGRVMKRNCILWKKNQPLMNFLCLLFSVSTGAGSPYTLDQSPSFLSIQEGEHAIINCTYQKKTLYNFHWFRQDPGKRLVSLTLAQSSQKEQADKRIKELLGIEKLYSVLHIPASHPGDSTTYFCALQQAQCSPNTCCLYPNLVAALVLWVGVKVFSLFKKRIFFIISAYK